MTLDNYRYRDKRSPVRNIALSAVVAAGLGLSALAVPAAHAAPTVPADAVDGAAGNVNGAGAADSGGSANAGSAADAAEGSSESAADGSSISDGSIDTPAAVDAGSSVLDASNAGSAAVGSADKGSSISGSLGDDDADDGALDVPVPAGTLPGTVLTVTQGELPPADESSPAGALGAGSSAARGSANQGSSDRGDSGQRINPSDVTGTQRIIAFASTTQRGDIVPVGGVVYVPDAPWTGPGARPTVVVAPGTVGQADRCAPSRSAHKSDDGFVGQARTLMAEGYRVIVTDYIGLGGPGIHTYANRVEQGRVVLDAARASLAVDGLPTDSPIGLWGYSQGGGATASAAELQGSYAPELNIRGTYAGAPPANLAEVLREIDGSLIMGAIGYAVNGFLERNPDALPALAQIASPRGAETLAGLAGDCIGDSVDRTGLRTTSDWTVDGRSLAEHFDEHPVIQRILDENRIGRIAPTHPVLVANGTNDDVIPHAQARALVRDWCSLGADAVFRDDKIPPLASGAAVNHALPAMVSDPAALDFLADRFAGKPLEGGCTESTAGSS